MQHRGSRIVRRVVAAAAALASLAPAAAQTTPASTNTGILREGFWVLNQARSKKLNPATQTLWIVKDDGDRITWVSVQRDPAGKVTISSWDGRYDGKPVEVKGTGMMTHLIADGPGKFRNWGEIPGLGTYSEDCSILDDGKRLSCAGTVTTAAGVKTWIDDFDWHSKNLN